MTFLRILLYEHFCGGGCAEHPLVSEVLAEAYAMLRSATADFKRAGHEVTVLLDIRLIKLNSPLDADCIVPVIYAEESLKFLACIAQINDAIYVIAPESCQKLEYLVKRAEKTNKIVLNCKSHSISKVSNKEILYETLQRTGVQTPKTLILNVNDPEGVKRALDELGYPAVFKPTAGTGCSGITLLKSDAQIGEALKKLRKESKSRHFIAQQYVDGESASVCLITDGKKAVALSLNRQQINLAISSEESSYLGGIIPFEHPMMVRALRLAEKAVESFQGLKGYVGVDMVLGDGGLFVVDINARLTTSYVGLRCVSEINFAEAIVQVVMVGKLPLKLQNDGVACLQKIQIPLPSLEVYRKTLSQNEIVSPPFPLEGSTSSFAIILGLGGTLEAAQIQLSRANKALHSIIC